MTIANNALAFSTNYTLLGAGTVFKITTSGTLTTLYAFTGGTDGGEPYACLVLGNDDNLYGTTCIGGDLSVDSADGATGVGTVFRITPGGALTTLYAFTNGADGANPSAGLVQGADGDFYGTTNSGGNVNAWIDGVGTVFKITPSGALTTLYAFSDGTDGACPSGAALVQGSDGNFYGATQFGGDLSVSEPDVPTGAGAIFKITPAGVLTTLYSFTAGVDGAYPLAGVVIGSDGSIYGTTQAAGANGDGTVFKLSPVLSVPPTLTSLSVDLATAGGPAATITVIGTHFAPGDQVQWNGAAVKTTYVSSTKLSAAIPASDLATAGAFTITVANPAAGNSSGDAETFTVDNPVPTLSSLRPKSDTVGSGGITITVTGSRFAPGAQAKWNGSALATTRVCATKLTATAPASCLATAGTYEVTVTNPAPGGGSSKAAAFTVDNPMPTLTSVTPNSAAASSPSATISITGANFVPASVVKWNSSTLATSYISPTHLTATVPPANMAKAGAFTIKVVNPAPGGGISKAASFKVIKATRAAASVLTKAGH